eukprot:365644-Chlamydomonas_euryale.AAC.4
MARLCHPFCSLCAATGHSCRAAVRVRHVALCRAAVRVRHVALCVPEADATARTHARAFATQELYSWMFCEPNPISVNTALAMCGLADPVFRLPYVPLSAEQRQAGAKLLARFQEHIPGCSEVRVMEDSEFKLIGKH